VARPKHPAPRISIDGDDFDVGIVMVFGIGKSNTFQCQGAK
jgi:hypothetical protein